MISRLSLLSSLHPFLSHFNSQLLPIIFQLTLPTMTRGFATISPECETVFDEVKETDNLDYVIYEASAHDKKITVNTSGKYKEYSELLAHFKDDTPRYAVVDFKYDSPSGEGQRHKLVFITWYVTFVSPAFEAAILQIPWIGTC